MTRRKMSNPISYGILSYIFNEDRRNSNMYTLERKTSDRISVLANCGFDAKSLEEFFTLISSNSARLARAKARSLAIQKPFIVGLALADACIE
jgi:hypothetical protein